MSDSGRVDSLVIDAGPVGPQAGHFLGRAGQDHLSGEKKPVPGAFSTRFPRHRNPISINKVHRAHAGPADFTGRRVLVIGRAPGGRHLVGVRFSRADETVEKVPYGRAALSAGPRFDISVPVGEFRPDPVAEERFPDRSHAWKSTDLPHLHVPADRVPRQDTSGLDGRCPHPVVRRAVRRCTPDGTAPDGATPCR